MSFRKPTEYLVICFVLASCILSACIRTPQDVGTIKGHVSVGPLTPVTRLGEPEPTVNPEFYQGREIIIYKPDGKTEIRHLQIDRSGDYQANLPVGRYVVNIERKGIETAKDLPKDVLISKDAITQLDIDIDTGIR